MGFASQFPNMPVAIADPQTGNVTAAWRYFFLALWNRTGAAGGSASIVLDQIGNIPGDILFRGPIEWQTLDPTNNGQVLRLVDGLPAWTSGVQSVGISAPSIFAVGPAVTDAGNLLLTFVAQGSNTFLAGPFLPGAAVPTFRTLAPLDLTKLTLRVVVAAGAIAVDTNDYVIVVNKTVGAATTVNLMATPATNTVLFIKDGKGDGATHNITITPAAGTIDGAATKVINTNYGSLQIVYNGAEWNVLV